jgi:phage gpG-like protein
VRARAANPAPLLKAFGALLLKRSLDSFRAQGFFGFPWRPRRVPNVAGIVADLNAGRTPPKRRFEPRPALVDTGKLRQSLAVRVVTDAVEVGTVLPYAALQQAGGKTTIQLKPEARGSLANLLRKRPELGKALGGLLRRPRRTVKVPARPFVGITPKEADDLAATAARYLAGGQP